MDCSMAQRVWHVMMRITFWSVTIIITGSRFLILMASSSVPLAFLGKTKAVSRIHAASLLQRREISSWLIVEITVYRSFEMFKDNFSHYS